jgi:hypothetical protein
MKKPKLCVDCKWMGRDCDDGTPICKRPSRGERSNVTGFMIYPSCDDEREEVTFPPLVLLLWLIRCLSCGEQGRFFKPNAAMSAEAGKKEKEKSCV